MLLNVCICVATGTEDTRGGDMGTEDTRGGDMGTEDTRGGDTSTEDTRGGDMLFNASLPVISLTLLSTMFVLLH